MHVIRVLCACDLNVITVASLGMWLIVTWCKEGALSTLPRQLDLAVDETLLVYYYLSSLPPPPC